MDNPFFLLSSWVMKLYACIKILFPSTLHTFYCAGLHFLAMFNRLAATIVFPFLRLLYFQPHVSDVCKQFVYMFAYLQKTCYSCSVCLSVCPFICLIYQVKMAEWFCKEIWYRWVQWNSVDSFHLWSNFYKSNSWYKDLHMLLQLYTHFLIMCTWMTILIFI
jgi:hypothetical protein